MSEVYTQSSIFPYIAPDYTLGEQFDHPEDCVKELLATLGEVGITLSKHDFTTYYGRVKIAREGLLEPAEPATASLKTPNHNGHVGDEHWRFRYESEPIIDVVGYIESLSLVRVAQRPEPAIRTTPNITDMGLSHDRLILAKHIKSIDTLAPWVSESLVIADNELAGAVFTGISIEVARAWWGAFVTYLDNEPDLRTVWTPEQGATEAWN